MGLRPDLLALAAISSALLAATAWHPAGRAALARRTRTDWLIDGLGLLVQGLVIPWLQLVLVVGGLSVLAPAWQGRLHLPFAVVLAVQLIGVDYLYYWNHRALHGRLWPWHRLHHTLPGFDGLGTSRNTLWTSLLIVYLWAHGVLLYLLADPTPLLLGAALTAAGDVWRHSPLVPPAWLAERVRGVIVLPDDHARHHAPDAPPGNFGANLLFWDRLHGTALAPHPADGALGLPERPRLRALWWPDDGPAAPGRSP